MEVDPLSLLWEIFMNIFQAKGFSTVSLGALVRTSDHESCFSDFVAKGEKI